MTAQGIALGIYQGDSLALKGRNNLSVSRICFALSGHGVSDLIVPRALPWAGMFRPFQGKYRNPSKAFRRSSLRQCGIAKWRCPTRQKTIGAASGYEHEFPPFSGTIARISKEFLDFV